MINPQTGREILPGTVAQIKRIYTLKDVEDYAALTGDHNPIHFDANYAANTFFKKPIIHGPLITTLITTLFANELPGPGAVYLAHELRYSGPVYINDEITARLEVTEITDKKHIIIKTTCTNQKDEVVISGTARLKLF